MNIRIKTAHGYLSFQPDGRVEYRDKAGSWETLDVEGLELPSNGSNPAPGPNEPVPAFTIQYVSDVKAKLEREGVNLSGPCGAFEITKNVAWGLRFDGAGLLSKPSGNNCNGYATDIVAFRDRAYDVLSDAGGGNFPLFNLTSVDDLAGRYRPAIQP